MASFGPRCEPLGFDIRLIVRLRCMALRVKNRAARMGRNPATGEAIEIKASKKVAFRAAKDLSEAI